MLRKEEIKDLKKQGFEILVKSIRVFNILNIWAFLFAIVCVVISILWESKIILLVSMIFLAEAWFFHKLSKIFTDVLIWTNEVARKEGRT